MAIYDLEKLFIDGKEITFQNGFCSKRESMILFTMGTPQREFNLDDGTIRTYNVGDKIESDVYDLTLERVLIKVDDNIDLREVQNVSLIFKNSKTFDGKAAFGASSSYLISNYVLYEKIDAIVK